MIVIKCNNCKQVITEPKRDTNFFQPLANNRKPQGELCKQCYEQMCQELDIIENKYSLLKTNEETIVFKKYNLKKE
jgi:hypothetical protein